MLTLLMLPLSHQMPPTTSSVNSFKVTYAATVLSPAPWHGTVAITALMMSHDDRDLLDVADAVIAKPLPLSAAQQLLSVGTAFPAS